MNSQVLTAMSQLLLLEGKSVTELSKTLAKGKQQVVKEIAAINAELQEEVIVIRKKQLTFSDNAYEVLYKHARSNGLELTVLASHKVRRDYLLLRLLMTPDTFELGRLTAETTVSKNTLLTDIKMLKKWLQANECRLTYSHAVGYQLVGDELVIRKLLNTAISQLVETTVGKVILFHYRLLNFDDYFMMNNRLEKLEKSLAIYYSDEIIESLPYALLAVIERSRHVQQALVFPKEISYLFETEEYVTITAIFWDYPFLKPSDLMYLTLQVLSANVIESTFVDEQMVEIEELINQFIISLESRLAISFKNKTTLQQLLLQHIKPAIFRNYIGAHVINPLTNQFMEEYTSFFEIVKVELRPFNCLTKQEMSNAEISFIAMIILGFMVNNTDKHDHHPFSAVVVCQSGTSISRLLLNNLRGLFPNINFTHVLSYRQSEKVIPPVDFIFSTIPLVAEQPTFIVKTLMNQEEKVQLVTDVQMIIDQDKQKVTRELLSQLTEIIPQGKQGEATRRLESYFETKENVAIVRAVSPLTSASQIEFITEGRSVLEVTEQLFQKMQERETIQESYRQKSLENVLQHQETMILAPSVLLPHASFADGVHQMDVQIGILKQPLAGAAGQRYQMIIALAPDPHNQHVNWLVKMNELLIKQLPEIICYQTAEAVYALLEGAGNGV